MHLCMHVGGVVQCTCVCMYVVLFNALVYACRWCCSMHLCVHVCGVVQCTCVCM